jgi:hypothetical protein
MTKKNWCQDAGCDLCPAIESIQHITLHCKYSSWVWDKFSQDIHNPIRPRQSVNQVWSHGPGMANLFRCWNAKPLENEE